MIRPFGDSAVRFDVPSRGRRGLLDALLAIPGVRDVVIAEEIGCVVWRDGDNSDRDEAAIRCVLESVGDRDDVPARQHRIEVVYDGEDLDSVAATIHRTRAEVIELHSSASYRVSMLGFMPGFAYLRGLNPELVLPRRAPRPRVPPHSVAIAADYAGIYPFASPGGWHLLGRAVSFDPFRGGQATFAIGDVVQFVPVSRDAAAHGEKERDAGAGKQPIPETPHLEITRAAGFAIPVREHVGRMHEGIPPGGPLIRSTCARANRLVDNDDDACAVEIVGVFEMTARNGSVNVVVDGEKEEARRLEEGETLRIESGPRRARYLAIEGGVDSPFAPGPVKLLKRGDRIAPMRDSTRGGTRIAQAKNLGGELTNVIEILPGPDVVEGVWDKLASSSSQPFRVASSSNRTGVRLEAPSLTPPSPSSSAMQRASTPMVIGAIELTPSGLIVLGPDHPTTGGYPVVAVVRSRSLDSFFATPIGGSVYFSE